MKVTFTRSVLVAGEHNEEGSTAEFDDATTAQLFASGSVIAAPEVEPTPEVEPATKKKSK